MEQLVFFSANYLEALSYLILATSLFNRNRLAGLMKYSILTLYYFFLTFLFLLGSVLSKNNHDNNWTYNLFIITTIITFSFYFNVILTKKLSKLLVKFLFVANTIIYVLFVIVPQKFFSFYNSEVFGFCFLSIVVFSFLYFFQVMTNIGESNILQNFDIWLVSCYLIYFLGGFFVVLFYHNASVVKRAMIWSLLDIILFITAIISFMGAYRIRKQEKFE